MGLTLPASVSAFLLGDGPDIASNSPDIASNSLDSASRVNAYFLGDRRLFRAQGDLHVFDLHFVAGAAAVIGDARRYVYNSTEPTRWVRLNSGAFQTPLPLHPPSIPPVFLHFSSTTAPF